MRVIPFLMILAVSLATVPAKAGIAIVNVVYSVDRKSHRTLTNDPEAGCFITSKSGETRPLDCQNFEGDGKVIRTVREAKHAESARLKSCTKDVETGLTTVTTRWMCLLESEFD